MKTAFFLALITLIPALSKAAVAQTVYYVEPAGKNTNPGTEDRPWQTIQHAANRLLAGDSVYIRAGVYKERIIPKNSGAPGSYIAYSAYHGEKVTIDGAGIILPENWGGLFHIYGRTHIKVAGLHIINAGPHDNNAGILVDGSSHIILKNNYTYNTVSSGIGAWNSHDIIIDGNEIELACNDGEQESLTVAVTDRFVVRNNHVHHGGPGSTGGEGIDIKDGSSNGLVYNNYVHDMNRLGIYVDAWDKHTHNIEVFRNRVHDCDDRGIAVASESGGLLENIAVHNNVVYNNRLCGFEFSDYSELSGSRPMRHILVINNTFYNNGRGEAGGGICVLNPDIQDSVLRNNIISRNRMFQIEIKAGVHLSTLTIDHNLIHGYPEYMGGTQGTDYTESDPMFLNPAAADFHLQHGSPAIDKGSSVDAPDFDYEGNLRPRGPGYDLGAYEYFTADTPD